MGSIRNILHGSLKALHLPVTVTLREGRKSKLSREEAMQAVTELARRGGLLLPRCNQEEEMGSVIETGLDIDTPDR